MMKVPNPTMKRRGASAVTLNDKKSKRSRNRFRLSWIACIIVTIIISLICGSIGTYLRLSSKIHREYNGSTSNNKIELKSEIVNGGSGNQNWSYIKNEILVSEGGHHEKGWKIQSRLNNPENDKPELKTEPYKSNLNSENINNGDENDDVIGDDNDDKSNLKSENLNVLADRGKSNDDENDDDNDDENDDDNDDDNDDNKESSESIEESSSTDDESMVYNSEKSQTMDKGSKDIQTVEIKSKINKSSDRILDIYQSTDSSKVGNISDKKKLKKLKITKTKSIVFMTKLPFQVEKCTRIDSVDITYTLVTQLDFDRLWTMRHNCPRWGLKKPLSIAVFTTRTKKDIMKRLVGMGCAASQFEHEGDPFGGLAVLSPNFYDDDEYPVNKLRNMALSRVKTSHVMYVDADFFVSIGLWKGLMSMTIRSAFANDPKLAVVIPAFQMKRQCKGFVDCRNDNLDVIPVHTKKIMECLEAEGCSMFDPKNAGGHGSTDYEQWLTQKKKTLVSIKCIKSYRYEPYLAFRLCDELPPFQEIFTGYGKNKLAWFMQLRREGYIVKQLGGEFVIHYPHLSSKARKSWDKTPKEMKEGASAKDLKGKVDFASYRRGQVDKTFVDFREWLRETDDKTTTRLHMCQGAEMAKVDDSKLWIS